MREEGSSGVLTPVYNNRVECRGKIGDTIIDPISYWNDSSSPFEVNQEVEAGCLHVFKNKRDAIRAANSNLYQKAVVKVEILPGLLLIGHTLRFAIELDPLSCYGCKSYKLIKIEKYSEEN
jgi:hypothetical protein